MINRQALLSDLQALLKRLEADLLERSESAEVPAVGESLRAEYDRAKDADRTALSWVDWREGEITQVAAAWVLSCVFVRFLEDNQLIDPPKLAGPGDRLRRARDEHELYFGKHPTETDREYLLSVFDQLAELPGTAELFGEQNPLRDLPNWLGPDAAGELLRFFQKVDASSGELVHDFTDPEWGTRFLGDLYQDLSEAARKRYALLQTPDFVEAFILDRTLEPALDEFGLVVSGQSSVVSEETDNRQLKTEYFKMIDPACGSGHFLLGAFHRILDRWQRAEPGINAGELVQRTLDSVHGVDVNPYAVAIARFRLLLAAMKAAGVRRLRDAPKYRMHLACGDSLYHGKAAPQQMLGDDWTDESHFFHTENAAELRRLLKEGTYHCVVANPPYITPKDKAANQTYRRLYESCHRQYSLAVPFMERIFKLAVSGQRSAVSNENGGDSPRAAGYTGQITANSYMKREFGKKLIEEFLPKVDLTHVVDTSGAYIPGHGTPTVILFGRNQKPLANTVRAVMGIRGEPATPDDPANGFVWRAITEQIDQPGSESDFVSVGDTERDRFSSHPWSIGGGGAAELKESLDEDAVTLARAIYAIGRTTVVGDDDAWVMDEASTKRHRLSKYVVPFVVGECVRDWSLDDTPWAIYPYESLGGVAFSSNEERLLRQLWPVRCILSKRVIFGKTLEQQGRPWWEHLEHYTDKLRTPLSIVFAFVATHNHFVLDRGGKVFKQSAPVIKLPEGATEEDHLALLGLLNSSVACFWMKQVFQPKSHASQRHHPDEARAAYEFAGTQLKLFPLPEALRPRLATLARIVDELASERASLLQSESVDKFFSASESASGKFSSRWEAADRIREKMIAVQEELDWEAYAAYGLVGDDLTAGNIVDTSDITCPRGSRPFEQVFGRRSLIRAKKSVVPLEEAEACPLSSVSIQLNELYERRKSAICTDGQLALIEQMEFKRLWRDCEDNITEYEFRKRLDGAQLATWLLDRMESYFDIDGRMSDQSSVVSDQSSGTENRQLTTENYFGVEVTSVGKLADIARADERFQEVGAVYTGDQAFDVTRLVEELVRGESVPLLPVLRYKPSGLRKRAAWEETWELQRREDELAAQRQAARDRMQHAKERLTETLPKDKANIDARREMLWDHFRLVRDRYAPNYPTPDTDNPVIAVRMLGRHGVSSDGGLALAGLDQQRREFETLLYEFDHKVNALCRDDPQYQAAVEALESIPADPEIPVPPKFASGDFISTGGARYWALRGKLDVPKERWVSFPHCEGADGTPVIAWAGLDHLQLAQAISAYFVDIQERLGGRDDPRLVPLLGGIIELLPWLRQWHSEIDPQYNQRMDEVFEGFVTEEAKNLGMTIDEIKAWTPPKKTARRKKKATS